MNGWTSFLLRFFLRIILHHRRDKFNYKNYKSRKRNNSMHNIRLLLSKIWERPGLAQKTQESPPRPEVRPAARPDQGHDQGLTKPGSSGLYPGPRARADRGVWTFKPRWVIILSKLKKSAVFMSFGLPCWQDYERIMSFLSLYSLGASKFGFFKSQYKNSYLLLSYS